MNEEDTLFEDATGHAADLFADIEEGGHQAAVRLLTMSPQEMGMEDDTCHILAIEALCGAGGQPSISLECRDLRAWGEANPASLDTSVKEKMISLVDDAASQGANAEIASRMRSRIQALN